MRKNVTYNSVRDRYKRISDHFDKRDSSNRRISGVCGEAET